MYYHSLSCVQRHTLRFGATTVGYFGPISVNGTLELARVIGKYTYKFSYCTFLTIGINSRYWKLRLLISKSVCRSDTLVNDNYVVDNSSLECVHDF